MRILRRLAIASALMFALLGPAGSADADTMCTRLAVNDPLWISRTVCVWLP